MKIEFSEIIFTLTSKDFCQKKIISSNKVF